MLVLCPSVRPWLRVQLLSVLVRHLSVCSRCFDLVFWSSLALIDQLKSFVNKFCWRRWRGERPSERRRPGSEIYLVSILVGHNKQSANMWQQCDEQHVLLPVPVPVTVTSYQLPVTRQHSHLPLPKLALCIFIVVSALPVKCQKHLQPARPTSKRKCTYERQTRQRDRHDRRDQLTIHNSQFTICKLRLATLWRWQANRKICTMSNSHCSPDITRRLSHNSHCCCCCRMQSLLLGACSDMADALIKLSFSFIYFDIKLTRGPHSKWQLEMHFQFNTQQSTSFWLTL